MKTTNSRPQLKNKQRMGFTLLELVVVMSILLVLVSATTVSVTAYKRWKYGLEAGETLKAVYQAQKLYLADNPTLGPGSLSNDDTTKTNLMPYLPQSINAVANFPDQVPGEDGELININVGNVPPTVEGEDPSKDDSDGLWDVNE